MPNTLTKTDAEWAAMTLPKSGLCVVTDDAAVMDVEYFDQLLEYSASIPTGMFIGKRWKCRSYEGNWWYLREYFPSDEPNTVTIRTRRITQVTP